MTQADFNSETWDYKILDSETWDYKESKHTSKCAPILGVYHHIKLTFFNYYIIFSLVSQSATWLVLLPVINCSHLKPYLKPGPCFVKKYTTITVFTAIHSLVNPPGMTASLQTQALVLIVSLPWKIPGKCVMTVSWERQAANFPFKSSCKLWWGQSSCKLVLFERGAHEHMFTLL